MPPALRAKAQPSGRSEGGVSVGHEDLRCACVCLVASTPHTEVFFRSSRHVDRAHNLSGHYSPTQDRATRTTTARAATASDTVVVDVRPGAAIDDVADDEMGPDPALPPMPQLAWLIWPTTGLEDLLEGGAMTILEAESDVAAETPDRGTVTWTTICKLTNVQLLRRIATRAQPRRRRPHRRQPGDRVAARGRPVRSPALHTRDLVAARASRGRARAGMSS